MDQVTLGGRPPGRGAGKSGTTLGAVVVVLVLLVVAALGYGTWSWAAGPRANEGPLESRAFEDGCAWPREYFPRAAAYTGEAPHPVQILIEEHAASGDYYTGMVLLAPNAAERLPGYLNPRETAEVQLLACLDQTGQGRQVRTCRFAEPSATVPVYEATYDITVYEARTGAKVGTAVIPAATTASCPMLLSYDSDDEPKIFTKPSARQVDDALASFTRAY
ncbi:hypothetical protein ABN028_01235 [Actinopolymorpha sp. B17G11]|uniref:hypothetical protein n=1 Tax=Actinopolymorpha sp. B17G11 TaxID=3160861 RepID=UPI0032E40B20